MRNTPPNPLDAALGGNLAQRESANLYRRRRVVDGPSAPETVVDGHKVLAFCSNDYLGIAADKRLVDAAGHAMEKYGFGAGSAHLVAGHTREHDALERELAEFVGRERALLFSTGYMANLGIGAALAGRGDAVFEDRLNHASLLDAGLISGARFTRYRHADAATLEEKLARSDAPLKLVFSDGIFSMDGDIAPLPELATACRRQQAYLCVDDAHALGVLGKNGRGSVEHFRLQDEDVPVLMGTLGKALGGFGAFVAGSETLVETLIQYARTYIYTTAPPAAIAAAVRAALKIVQQEPWRRDTLRSRVREFRQGATQLGLKLGDSDTPIQPLLVGDADKAVALSHALFEKGIFVTAIRPPTVPRGSARLRVTLSAAHESAHVRRLLDALDQCKASAP